MDKLLKKILGGNSFSGVSKVRSRMMSSIRGKRNRSTEQTMRMLLTRGGVRGWKLQAQNLPGTPDVYFPKRNVALFVDGCFWHGCPKCGHIPKTRSKFWRAKIQRNKKRHALVAQQLRRLGVRTVRIWEHCLNSTSTQSQTLDRLRKIL